MEALDLLNKKLNLLIKKYVALEAENKRLKLALAQHEETEELLKQRILALEEDMVSVDMDKLVTTDEDRINMRLQLDNVINDIDSILNNLND